MENTTKLIARIHSNTGEGLRMKAKTISARFTMLLTINDNTSPRIMMSPFRNSPGIKFLLYKITMHSKKATLQITAAFARITSQRISGSMSVTSKVNTKCSTCKMIVTSEL